MSGTNGRLAVRGPAGSIHGSDHYADPGGVAVRNVAQPVLGRPYRVDGVEPGQSRGSTSERKNSKNPS